MAKGKFKCPKCDRTFSMAAHLARHQSTTHGMRSGGKKAGRAKTGRRGRPASYARSASDYGALQSNGAAHVMAAMQEYYDDLNARRNALDAEMNNLASVMASLGSGPAATPARRGPGRPPGRPAATAAGTRRGRAGSLREYVEGVLKSSPQPMSPRDIAGAVKKSGYKTKAKDLTKAVSNLLPHLSGLKKVGFGKYKM